MFNNNNQHNFNNNSINQTNNSFNHRLRTNNINQTNKGFHKINNSLINNNSSNQINNSWLNNSLINNSHNHNKFLNIRTSVNLHNYQNRPCLFRIRKLKTITNLVISNFNNLISNKHNKHPNSSRIFNLMPNKI